jgi:uncharacterized protein (DUF4213/DUF364 family)
VGETELESADGSPGNSPDPDEHDIARRILDEVERLPQSANARTLDVRIGPFWTVVSTSEGAGIASTLASEARPHHVLPVVDAGRLNERRPVELANLLTSDSPTEAAVGLATVNALIGFPQGRVTSEKALHVLLDRCRGRRVAMVGHFPFAETLRPVCEQLWIFERGDGLHMGDRAVEDMPELLPQADVVAITATTLINKTLATVLGHVGDQTWTMMLGPSTPMNRCLLDNGFDVVCGTVVDDVERVLRMASQGGVTKQITGVRRVCLWK